MAERFDAEYKRLKDKKFAATAALEGLLPPATVSIITDACGVLIIAFAPIPILHQLGITGCLWLLTDLVSVLVMAPILYTYFPIPKKTEEEGGKQLLTRILRATGSWCLGKTRWTILLCVLTVIIWSGYNFQYLTIGDARPGTPLLWPDSPYNNSVKMINSKFPGTDKLIIVVRGNKLEMIKKPQVLSKMDEFEKHLSEHPKVGAANSVTTLVKHLNMSLHYDNPKWRFLPHEEELTGAFLATLQESGEPGDFDKFCDWFFHYASITIFLKDHHGDTIREIMERAKEFIKSNPLTEAKFELAGGLIGILAAANEVIARTHEFNLCAILLFIYLCCSLAYRSLIGGLFFVVSLLIANFFTLATMAKMGIGLNINTVPVVSIGVGLGVDYGLYIVSRIKDEYQKSLDLSDAIITSLSTAGKAVLYTATLITLSLVFWYFSPLRFQAEMGLLLAVVLIMNMLGAMFLLPTIIFLIKPKFIIR
jgi:predicted RND superfamily exporter protein